MQNKHASHMLPPQLSGLCFQRFSHNHTQPPSLTSTVPVGPKLQGSGAQPAQEGVLMNPEPCEAAETGLSVRMDRTARLRSSCSGGHVQLYIFDSFKLHSLEAPRTINALVCLTANVRWLHENTSCFTSASNDRNVHFLILLKSSHQ